MRRSAFVLTVSAMVVFALWWSITGSAATILTETVGNPSGTTAITSYTGWSNPSLTFTGTGDVRNTSPSTGYTGASGQGNVFLTNTVGRDFQIAGINTTGYTSLSLSFGIFKSTTAGTGADLIVEVTSDGTNYTALSYTALPTGAGTANWFLRTATGTIPATANLRIRFRQNGIATQYRIDDVALTGTPPPPTISVTGGPLNFPNTGIGSNSASQSYNVSGSNLTANSRRHCSLNGFSSLDG